MLDITKQVKLESEREQSQKLESVGRLAAGVAHEINTPVQFVTDSVQFLRDALADLMIVVDKHRTVTRATALAEPPPSWRAPRWKPRTSSTWRTCPRTCPGRSTARSMGCRGSPRSCAR